MDRQQAPWTVAVAVKPLAQAKSRLGTALSTDARQSLAVAMARDVVRAVVCAASVRRCVVVTADETAAASLRDLGADVLGEPVVNGLNAAYELVRDWAGDRPLALLMADLPCLTPAALDDVLVLVPAERPAVVADLEGTGTTLLAARHARLLLPQFGAGSRRRHVRSGAIDLSDRCPPTVRHDVDTWQSLCLVALARTAGPSTSAWLRRFAVPGVPQARGRCA